jgi:hypothetical protein
MAHESMFTRNRGSFVAVLLGALACGDGSGDMSPGTGSTSTTPPLTMGVGSSPPNAGDEPPPGTASEEMSAGGVAANDGSGASGASSAAEGPSSDPIMLGGAATSPGGAADTPSDAVPSDAVPSDAVPSPEPAAPPSAGASLARGADPTRESAAAPGPFGVTTLSMGLRDGPDYGSQTLHVPQGVEPPLAAVAIVPGFDTPESSIQAWGPFLASHGIVTLTIGTNDPRDSADARARAVLDALATIEAENARPGSPLEGNLALDHLAIMGWSLGGGGVLSAASSTPSLKAAITMAAFAPGGQFPDDRVPTLLLAGSADPNAGGQSQGIFASIPNTTPKMLFEVLDGPHEVGNDPANANGEIGLYGLSWLEVFLVGDERYRQFLEVAPSQASDFQENLALAP